MKLRIMVLLLVALTAPMLIIASADATGPVTPLSEEPIALSIDGNQQITDHAQIPDECSVTVDRTGVPSCIEVISDWICPAGPYGRNPLSEDAKARFAPSYNEAVGVDSPRAYLDSHCLLIGVRPMPVPPTTISCQAGQIVMADSAGNLVCAVLPTPTPVPTVAPTSVPVPVTPPTPSFAG